MKKIQFMGFFVFLCLFCGFGTAITMYQTESQLILSSDQIIYGEIVAVNSAWNSQRTHIETTAQVLVNDTLKNIENTTIQPGSLVPITVLGGAVGNETEWVEDMPVLINNTEGIFFLKKGSSGKNSVLKIISFVNDKTENPYSLNSTKKIAEYKQKISAVLQTNGSLTPAPSTTVPPTKKAAVIFAPFLAFIVLIIILQNRRK